MYLSLNIYGYDNDLPLVLYYLKLASVSILYFSLLCIVHVSTIYIVIISYIIVTKKYIIKKKAKKHTTIPNT